MGYNTDFSGSFTINPPLNLAEISYLKDFANTRRMNRERGPYFVGSLENMGQNHDPDIIDYNNPPYGQPGLWCKWEVSDDGTEIAWNGAEKFYDAEEWMRYLVDHFLRYRGIAELEGPHMDPRIAHFTFDHIINGTVDAQGEEVGDLWRIVIFNNDVTRVEPDVTWPN